MRSFMDDMKRKPEPVRDFIATIYKAKIFLYDVIAKAPDADTAERCQEIVAKTMNDLNEVEVSVLGEADVSSILEDDDDIDDSE